MKKLLIIQSRVQHYRIPLFDKMKKKLFGRYKLYVIGGTFNGEAYGGVKRNYIHSINYNNLFIFHYWGGVFKKISAIKPDIIISTASPRNLSIYFILLYSYFKKIRIIGWSKINSKKIIKFKFYKRIFYNFFNEIILYGSKSAKELNKIGYLGKYVIANNTIDTEFIENNNEKINKIASDIKSEYKLENKKIILFLGRLDAEKRPIDMTVFEKVLAKDKKNILVFVGDGLLRSNIEMFKQTSKFSNQIITTGRVPFLYDYAWIKLSFVFIVPGQVGLAIKQAMLLRTPVIIADEHGVDAEVVVNDLTGLRFKKTIKSDLLYKFQKLESNSKLKKNIIKNSYLLIKKDHSIESMANKILELL